MNGDDPRWGCCHPGCDVHPARSWTGGGPVFRISPKGEAWVGACGKHFHLYAKKGQKP